MSTENESIPAPYHVFISHRMEDREIAMAIKHGLEGVAGNDKINVHVCTKNQGVQDWKKEIEQAIGVSITMVFLYTVEQEEAWRWCMYEIGLFKGLMLDDRNRKLICIKNSYLKELPSPVRDLEPYIADPDHPNNNGIDTFCYELLFSPKFTGRKLLDSSIASVNKKKKEAVKNITHAFERSRLKVGHYDRRITIKLTDNDNNEYTPVPYHVFISHRMEDREIAMAIKHGLEGVAGNDKIKVHVCTKNQGVQDWKKEIEKAIGDSITMVFLYTVEQEEAWRWCMYEIGLFKGLMISDKNRKLICIKNSYLKELPSPIRDLEPYIADPDHPNNNGIDTFCYELLFSPKFTGRKLLDSSIASVNKKKKEAVKNITHAFERSRLKVEHYDRRITIKLTDNDNKVVKNVNDAIINDNENTMQELFEKYDGITWKELYSKLEEINQTSWLDQVDKAIKAIETKNRFKKDLDPIIINQDDKDVSYIPLISSIVKNHISEKQNDGAKKWFEVTKLNIIFIKESLSRESLPELIPFCKIKMQLEPDLENKDNLRRLQKDTENKVIEPVVVEMNQMCLNLFNLRKDVFDQDIKDGKQWTASALIERLKGFGFVDEDNLDKLSNDQERVNGEIVYKGCSESEAYVPIAFNDKYTKEGFRNQCFLPCLNSMQIVGDSSSKHEAFLLVSYVKDFWPPDHEQNPYKEPTIDGENH